MKFLLNTAITLLVAALAVIYQDDIARFLGKSPIVVTTRTSIWYPYPGSGCPTKSAITYCSGEDDHFSPKVMRVKIVNRSGKPLETLIFTTDEKIANFDAYSPTLSFRGNKLYKNVNRASFSRLDAAEVAYIYVWADYLLSSTYSANGFYLTTEYGRIKIPYNARFDDEDLFPWIDTDLALFIILGTMAFVTFLVFFVALTYENFSKCLLSDESYYLGEAVRFRMKGKKFAVEPVPLNIQEEMRRINV